MEFSSETLNTFRILGTLLYALFAGSIAPALLLKGTPETTQQHCGPWRGPGGATARVFHFAFGGAIVPMVLLTYGALMGAHAMHSVFKRLPLHLLPGSKGSPKAP